MTYKRKRKKKSLKYDVSGSDYKLTKEFTDVMKYVGYNKVLIRFVQNELLQLYSSNTDIDRCACCGKHKYKVVMNHYVSQLPKDRKLCIECYGVDKLRKFTPIMNFTDAWVKVYRP